MFLELLNRIQGGEKSCLPLKIINLPASVPLLRAAVVFVIIGTQYIPGFYFLKGPHNCEFGFSFSVTSPPIENRRELLPSRTVKALLGFASFHLLGCDASLATSSRTLDEKECKRCQRFKRLSDFTLELLGDGWDLTVQTTARHEGAMFTLSFILEFNSLEHFHVAVFLYDLL